MIRLSLGRQGAGKTLSEVYEMLTYEGDRTIFTNIHLTNEYPNIKLLSRDMLVKKTLIKTTTKKDGTIEEKFKYEPNIDFWRKLDYPVKIIIDETALFYNSRRSMQHFNLAFNEWIYLIRRVLGTASDEGELVLIAQLGRTIDTIARDLADEIRYHMNINKRICSKCGMGFLFDNERFMGRYRFCLRCRSQRYTVKLLQIRRFHFQDAVSFEEFDLLPSDFKINAFKYADLVTRVPKPRTYFNKYDTKQIAGLMDND